jgi:putative transcriptional regulator
MSSMVEQDRTVEPSRFLTGQLLIAMPQMADPRFAQTVIYMCAHSNDGAMGLVINRQIDSISFPGLLKQLEIDAPGANDQIRVMFGGPVETGRGFVLHSPDYVQESTLMIEGDLGLTATMDILKDIASGSGPKRSLLALGYAGWAPGQLDHEIQANGWLHAPASADLIFNDDIDSKWDRALATLGINSALLSGEAGHA